jgi:hypothetical protein
MSLYMDQIAEAFCSYRLVVTYPYMTEGAAQFQDQENQTSSVASCDVFQFLDGRLIEMTSYVIELNKP